MSRYKNSLILSDNRDAKKKNGPESSTRRLGVRRRTIFGALSGTQITKKFKATYMHEVVVERTGYELGHFCVCVLFYMSPFCWP